MVSILSINHIKKILSKLFLLLNNLVPKKKESYLFISYPDYSDNSKYLYDYMVNEKQLNNCIWIVKEEKTLERLMKKKIKAVKFLSVKGVITFLRFKNIITSHGALIEIVAKNQNKIELWHGMTLKKIGFFDSTEKIKANQNDKIKVLMSTSELTRALMSSSFNIPPKKVKISGQPRNDVLFKSLKCSNLKLEKVIKKDLKIYNKVLLYMPTFRKGYISKNDGYDFSVDNFFRFKHFNSKYFLNYLKKEKILFLIKLHPLEEKIYIEEFKNEENIIFITTEELLKNDVDTYELLKSTDSLLTDYSSVYFDYLLLNKPILFITPDINEYNNRRGFVLTPYDDWTPGPKITDENKLISEIKKIEKDEYKLEREKVNRIINKYQDDKSSERVFKIIKELENE